MTLLDGSGTRLDAVAVELSGRGLRLAVDHKVAPGTAVRIETADAFYLAEVCYSAPGEHPMWQIGLKVDQVLNLRSDLARLRHFIEADATSESLPQVAVAQH